MLLLPEDEEVGGFPDGTPFDDMPSGTDVYLFEAGFKKGDKFRYVFDMGDHWEFKIQVKAVLDEGTDTSVLVLSKGENLEQYSSDW